MSRRQQNRPDEIGSLARALRSWQDASREREVLVAQAPVGIGRLDPGGRLLSANQRLGQMLGQPVQKLRGCILQELFPSDELAAQLSRWAAGRDSDVDHVELEVQPTGTHGRSTWCSITLGPMRGPGGDPEGSEAIVEDVTERRRQMERAARLERELWPRTKPGLQGYQVAGACRPAEDVAGDLYDWHEWPDGRLELTVADVMGKGIGAALVMTSLRAWLRAANETLGPAERLAFAAGSLATGADEDGTFVTVFQCRLDPSSGDLS